MSNLRWKVVTIIAVFVIFFGVGVYPLIAQHYGIHQPSWLVDKALKLGLDLKGGVHLVLRVETEDALRLETQTEMERLRGARRAATVNGVSLTQPTSTQFRVAGVPPDQDAVFRASAVAAETNFERSST